MKNLDTEKLQKHIDCLFGESQILNSEIRLLSIIGQQINARGYRNLDKAAILQELGQMQIILWQLHSEMSLIDDLLK